MDTSILLTLPANPPSVRILTTSESKTLDERYAPARMDPRNCITCGGAKTFRWYTDISRAEVGDYSCPCGDQYVLSRWLWHSGILLKYQRLSWGDFERLDDRVARQAMEYLDALPQMVSAGLGLTITGPRGNGKTLLAYLILKEAIARGSEVYATSFTQMIDTFADGWRDRASAQWFNQRLRDVEILFIDDLGRERNKGSGSVGDNMLETVIRHRVGCQMPTIITSNIDSAQIGEAYGGHTDSLLSEASVPMSLGGTDVRGSMLERQQQEIRDGLSRPVTLR